MTTLKYRAERQTKNGVPAYNYFNSTLRSVCCDANIQAEDINITKALTDKDYVDARYEVSVKGKVIGEITGQLELSLGTYAGTVMRRDSADRMTWRFNKAGETKQRYASTFDLRIEAIATLIRKSA